MEKLQNSSNLIFYQTSEQYKYESRNNASPYRFAPVTNKSDVESSLHSSTVGFGLPPLGWQKQLDDSTFCVSILGDTHAAHALVIILRTVKLGCIPVVVVVADSYPLVYAPTLK